jgi:hypothetical protein
VETQSLDAVAKLKARLQEIYEQRKTADFSKRRRLDNERDEILKQLGPTVRIRKRRSMWTR